MMGVETPETCWATHKHQAVNLWNCCILLVDLFELYDDARTCERQIDCGVWSFRSSVIEDSNFLGCDPVLLGDSPTFLWNVGNCSSNNAASCLRRLESWTSVIHIPQDNLSRPVYVPKTATEQLKEIFEKQRNSVSSLDEKQGEWWNVQVQKLYDHFVLHFWQ